MSRDLPRNLAPILFSAFNLASGASLIISRHDRLPGLIDVPRPLLAWGIAFVLLGLIIPFGIVNWRIAVVTSSLAFGLWVWWAWMLTEAVHPPFISPRTAVTPWSTAILHLLLAPYSRRRDRCDTD